MSSCRDVLHWLSAVALYTRLWTQPISVTNQISLITEKTESNRFIYPENIQALLIYLSPANKISEDVQQS